MTTGTLNAAAALDSGPLTIPKFFYFLNRYPNLCCVGYVWVSIVFRFSFPELTHSRLIFFSRSVIFGALPAQSRRICVYPTGIESICTFSPRLSLHGVFRLETDHNFTRKNRSEKSFPGNCPWPSIDIMEHLFPPAA